MGYETKLIIGYMAFGKIQEGDHGRYVIKVAEIDLCGSVFSDTFIDESDKLNPVNTSMDGNSNCWKDCYGNELYGNDPTKVLEEMKAANKRQEYRRYRAAIPLLESLIEDFKTQELTCILYGH